jgi:enterobactin synthetase component F
MNERKAYPLTSAQRGFYFSQRIAPTANMNLAEAVEICGPITPEIFQRALRQVVVEAEELRIRIIEEDGKPLQIVQPGYDYDFPYFDMSHEADPRAAIQAWMMAELAQPVDLINDRLWTCALLKAAEDRYFWYHRAHHIVEDGYGGGLIARRLAEVYTAYAQGNEPAPNSFCSVDTLVQAETGYQNSNRFQRDREYWQQQLAGMPEAITLSSSRQRHGLNSSLLRSSGYLSVEISRQLADFGKVIGASLPQVLISLIAAYYQRATGVSDLVFGMPVSGRLSSVLRNSVSVSANIVPIRASFTPEMTALDLVTQISKTVRQSLRHQQYRYENLRRDLGLVGLDQNIAWLNANIEPFDYRFTFDGAATILQNLSNSSAEDLMVFVYDRGTENGLLFDLDANPTLYGATELDEHRRRLTRLIEQVLANPTTPLQRLDIMGPEERQRLLTGWNDTAEKLTHVSLPTLVAQWAETTPDVSAVVFERTAVSFRQLHERSLRQAHQLRADGVKPGDIVAVALPRSEQLLVVLLAIMRTGAAYLPIDLESPVERTALVLEDASPVALIVQPEMNETFARFGLRLLQPERIDVSLSSIDQDLDLSTPEGTVYVLYTSGSTGRPKGVEITHRNLSNFLEGMRRQLKPRAEDRFLAVTTVIFDIAGLELYLPLMVGACVIMASSEAAHNPPSLARLIQRSGATHMQATPSLWRILLSSPEVKLHNVHVMVGGEALNAELAGQLKSMSARVTQFYGPTETTIWSTAFELRKGDIGIPPIGHPILNTQLYVLDEDRQPVFTGAIGELYIGGAGVAKGYLRRPRLTEERFLPNPFVNDGSRMYRTGDLVRWTKDGLLEFIGRADDQVKVNGHRVELGEIESLLRQHESIAEAAVIAQNNGKGATSLAGYIVAADKSFVDIDTLGMFLTGRLPSYMIPANFMLLDSMPLTPNGKLDRKALPAIEETRRDLYVEPVSPTEKKLAVLWQHVLKVDRVGLHDNFFNLGGDSLNAAEMVAHFPTYFDMELPLGSLFEAPTIAHLAKLVDRLSSESSEALDIVLPLRREARQAQSPLFCIHPISGISLGFSGLLRHLDPSIPVYGLQSRGLLGDTSLPASIEEIASDYLAQIRHIQPEGPYRLLGRSLGGLIGHSIAEQMQKQGLQVELLAMIDSHLFTSEKLSRRLTGDEEVQAALSFLNIDLDGKLAPQTLKELGEFLLHPDNAGSIPVAQGIMKLAKGVMKNDPEFIKHLSAVMFNNLKLARRYVPRTIDLGLVYFHATETTGELDGILSRGPSAWHSFFERGVEVHELPCHHELVLEPGPAAQIGRVLQHHLSFSNDRSMARNAPITHKKMAATTPSYV